MQKWNNIYYLNMKNQKVRVRILAKLFLVWTKHRHTSPATLLYVHHIITLMASRGRPLKISKVQNVAIVPRHSDLLGEKLFVPLLGLQQTPLKGPPWRSQHLQDINQFCFNVGSPPTTLAQHWLQVSCLLGCWNCGVAWPDPITDTDDVLADVKPDLRLAVHGSHCISLSL